MARSQSHATLYLALSDLSTCIRGGDGGGGGRSGARTDFEELSYMLSVQFDPTSVATYTFLLLQGLCTPHDRYLCSSLLKFE